MAVDRLYRDRHGRSVSVHLAVFPRARRRRARPSAGSLLSGERLDAGRAEVPCLGGRRSEVGDRRSEVRPPTSDLRPPTCRERGEVPGRPAQAETACLLYWYQIDGAAYTSGDGQRRLLLACRGRPVRPPIVKVMLQTSGANTADAEKTLQALAGEVYQWSRGFH